MSSYKLFGQVRKPCSDNGHWIIRFVEDDTYNSKHKLDSIAEHMIAHFNDRETPGGLIKPVFTCDDAKHAEDDNIKQPYTDTEFVVKVPTQIRECLPDIGTFVCLTVKPKAYKFEKNKYHYIGWSIVLKKFDITQYNPA